MLSFEMLDKKVQEMIAEIAARLASPEVKPVLDRAIEALIKLRQTADIIHGGGVGASPAAPQANPPAQSEASSGLTVDAVIDRYQTDKDSPYLTKSFVTRKHYTSLMRRLSATCGGTPIADLNGRELLRLHEVWGNNQKNLPVANATVGMLRMLASFGSSILNDDDCDRLSNTLRKLRFPMAKARTEHLSREQMIAIIEEAKKIDRPSIALAQAFQADLPLRQKIIIGEWVPRSEPGPEDIVDGNLKWVRGIRWEEIDSDLVLARPINKLQRVEASLKNGPLIMNELRRIAKVSPGETLRREMLPPNGPLIVSETTELPWRPNEFRRYWRKIADRLEIPRSVKNMDSRAKTGTVKIESSSDTQPADFAGRVH